MSYRRPFLAFRPFANSDDRFHDGLPYFMMVSHLDNASFSERCELDLCSERSHERGAANDLAHVTAEDITTGSTVSSRYA
jgi:hypothetical protein